LDQAFAAIDTAIANTETNLKNARELFESYLNKVFTEKGEGWEEKTVGELAEHRLGKMLDKRKNKGEFKPYIRNTNVRWFHVDTSDLSEMRFEESELEKYAVTKGDLVICEGGYPGRSAIWDRDEAIFFQKAIHRVRCYEPSHNPWILYYLFLCDANGVLKRSFTGTGIQHFTGASLKQFAIPIAPLDSLKGYLKRFLKLSKKLDSLESVNSQKLTALKELKQSLLQKAFTGELTADYSSEAVQQSNELEQRASA
jgi:type I restriction enzyme S subunit